MLQQVLRVSIKLPRGKVTKAAVTGCGVHSTFSILTILGGHKDESSRSLPKASIREGYLENGRVAQYVSFIVDLFVIIVRD